MTWEIGSERHGLDPCRFIDKSHDIIAIIDSRDPRWIWRAGESDRSDQYQRHGEGNEQASRIALNASLHHRGHVIRRIPQASHSCTPKRRMRGPYPRPDIAVKGKRQCKHTSSVEQRRR